jgi:hypothetical protein
MSDHARYAFVVSLTATDQWVDLHANIAAQVGAKITADIEIGTP